ncbi:basic proline-rich protein-like [Simochromis diagramma]|uniref:basic proline-rich protein-like n=1 Tax=Simochromis diagramma TaxID=43689 RepID=UPI001A7EB059|nr:basic proline-rich protein-like [Simochromis diagramma]
MGVADVRNVPAPVPATRLRPARTQPPTAPIPTPRVGAACTRPGPAPVPATRRRATEQPLGSPTAHPPAQPEPEVSAQRARWEPAKPSLEEEAEREGPCLPGEEEEKEEELRGGSCLLVKEMREDPHLPVVGEAREGPRLTGVEELLQPGAAAVEVPGEGLLQPGAVEEGEPEVPVPGEPAQPEGEACDSRLSLRAACWRGVRASLWIRLKADAPAQHPQ